MKPDGVQRALVGEIISRFERKGFTLKALRMFVPTKELAEEHYKDLSSKPFFNDLVSYITSGPVVAMVSVHSSPVTPSMAEVKFHASCPNSHPDVVLAVFDLADVKLIGKNGQVAGSQDCIMVCCVSFLCLSVQ